ncbi:hypothetical protein CERZMDRAFT_96456 [Cercospora zeae-maydis SCOH1-5]|uniref:F-box domain-containing protein n=1 Tax=Cercospora zeae-maydis SCOH1-5 TaxID=717836 RepID=A0A6A6FJK6_9PEZI|nr:hypothetical protein CERZMDRAFT_96456 [Cercospora zeae-maydis SCOH1-5]
MPAAPPLLAALPAELRLAVYEMLVDDDLRRFAASFSMPALLHTCRQLRSEYVDVFCSDAHVTISAYYGDTGMWSTVTGATAKLALICRSSFTHFVHYSSLASAQRYCERVCFSKPDEQRGILTVSIDSDGLSHSIPDARWWQFGSMSR